MNARPALRLHAWRAALTCAACVSAAAAPASAATINIVAIDRNGVVMPDVVLVATRLDGKTPAEPIAAAAEPVTAVVSQENLQFTPLVSVVRTGTAISFPNNDKIEHHVKSFSPTKEFEYKIYHRNTPAPVVFDRPGIVIVYCMLHGWMRSYVYVVDTPYFNKTTELGIASLDNLPEGSYEIRAWHANMGTIKKPLVQTVKAGGGVTGAYAAQSIAFNFDFAPRKPRAPR